MSDDLLGWAKNSSSNGSRSHAWRQGAERLEIYCRPNLPGGPTQGRLYLSLIGKKCQLCLQALKDQQPEAGRHRSMASGLPTGVPA